MSISYSNNHGVCVTLHGVLNQIPNNSDYRYVIPGNFALYDPNIMFDRVKDKYYADALSEIGRYTTGVDFKHYDDSRCKCVLCWTLRTDLAYSAGALNIPTVNAKFLFVLDQLRSEKFQFGSYMNLRRFTSIMYTNFPGITEVMITKLWNTLFQEGQSNNAASFNIRSELDQIVSGFDIVSLRDNDITGQDYPTGIQNSVRDLQKRIDDEFNIEKRNSEVCNLTDSELVSRHVYILEDKLHFVKTLKEEMRQLNIMWKHMFVRDFILDNIYSDRLLNKISENRVKNTVYDAYRDASTTAQKLNILSVKLREFESVIGAERGKDYFIDPVSRNNLAEACKRFNREFQVFLHVPERKSVSQLWKSEKIVTKVSIKFRTMRKKYKLTFLKQRIKKFTSDDGWVKIAKKALKLVQVEKDIHKFGFKSNGIPRINCKKELRGYIENAWNRMRTGQVAYTKDGKEYTPDDFKKREDALYAKKLEEYASEYADAKVFAYFLELSPDKRERVDRKWTHYQLYVAKVFYKKYGLKTYFNKKYIRKFWVKDTKYKESPHDKQIWLNSKYFGDGGYEENEMLKFMKWEIKETHKLQDLWAAVFWVEVQTKEKRFLWQSAWTEYSLTIPVEYGKKREITDQYSKFLSEAREIKEQRIRLKYETKAEMYLMFDIFGGGEVDDNKLDWFIRRNLPPSENIGFSELFRLRRLPPSSAVQERIKHIRSVYKKKVFDREIRKRALILPLKKMNEFLKEAWTDAFDRGEIDEQEMTDWQMSLRLNMDQYERGGKGVPFPYDRDWISHKYLNIRKWLTKDTKVHVLCKYEDLVTVEKSDKSLVTFKLGEPGPDAVMIGDAGYWVEVPFNPDEYDPNYIDIIKKQREDSINEMPEQWMSDRKSEDLKMAWVEEIHPDSVTVRFGKKFTIKKRYMLPQTFETARITLENVFDSILDYNVIRERTAEEQQKEEEKRNETKRLVDRDRERRLLIRNIVNMELIEEQKEQKMLEQEAEDALRMYDDSRANDRKQFFIAQLNIIMKPYLDLLNDRVGHADAYKKSREEAMKFVTKYKKEEHMVDFEVFKKGRDQWLEDTGIGKKKPWREGSDETAMRTRQEQAEFNLTYKIVNAVKFIGKRAESNRMTNEYRKFMYIYGRDTDESLRLYLFNKLEPVNGNVLSPDEKKKIMKKFKKGMEAAIKRDDDIHKFRNQMKYSRIIQGRRQRILKAIQDVIDDIAQSDEDERLKFEDDPKIREYILSGRLNQDVNFRLKTPKLMYTDEMWKSELETSLEVLDTTTYGELFDYVSKTVQVKYLQKGKRNPVPREETEYQRDFKTKNSELMPVYPTPSKRTLQQMAENFKPPVINDIEVKSEAATNVRIGKGPGAWFEINQASELMRQTNMSMEDRILFAEDVKSFREEENRVRLYNEKNSKTRERMAKILVTLNGSNYGSRKWIDSDGDESVRILDDLIGEFTYNEETLQSVRISGRNDVPTHVRLNTIYFDTVRGTENKQNVRRLVPFYVVSLYRKEGTSYKRLKVRNRADKTFLPSQNKHGFLTRNKKNKEKFKRLYSVEDYKGYACSVCLNEEEFQSLVNGRQLTATDRRIVQIPGPFLYKYHKLRFKREREKIEPLLIEKQRSGTDIRDEVVYVGDPDDLTAPFSDGMIRLGGVIQSMETQRDTIKIGGLFLDVDGNKVSTPTPEMVENREIHSNIMYATFNNNGQFSFRGNVVIYRFRDDNWDSFNVKETHVSPILKWCEDILLVAMHFSVDGYDTNNKCIKTLSLTGHSATITCMSVKENQIVTGSNDNTLMIWGNENYPIVRKSRVLVETGNKKIKYRFGNVVKVEDNRTCTVDLLKIPGKRATVGVYVCLPTSHKFSLRGHSGEVTSVVWGKYIVSSSEDKSIIVWDNDNVKYRLDFAILRLSDAVKPKRSYGTTYAPYIALINSKSLFYGVGNILGKANIETGKRVPFDNAVVNRVSELPIVQKIPMPKMPSRIYFDDLNVLVVRTEEEMQDLREMRQRDVERILMSMEDKYTRVNSGSDSSDGWDSDDSSDSPSPVNELATRMRNRSDILNFLDNNNEWDSYESDESSGWDSDDSETWFY